LQRGELDAARVEAALLTKRFPDSAGSHGLAARIAIAEKRPDTARASFERALQIYPDDLESLAGVIEIALSSGHQEEATARIDAALARMKPTGELLLLAATAYARSGNLTKTEDLLRRAIEADPARLKGYSLLGQLYLRQNRVEDGKRQFEEVLKRNPASVPTSTMIAILLEAQGRVTEAEKQYQATLTIDPRAAVAANNLAYLYVSSDRNLDQALQLAQTAKQQLPDEPHVNDTLGWVYTKKNMASVAIPHLESSVKNAPRDPVAQYHLGVAYFQTGDWLKAKDSLKRALALKPDFDGAADARQVLASIGT
jgi:tetratricopeptide (TPR) repeat protein